MGMKLGEVARLDVSADFAYGAEGMGDAIPPDKDLTFEVELLQAGDDKAKGGNCIIC
eukprot:SAG31_NODE_1383_length_8578_cov_3.660573_8_plen_57_part_00